MSRGYLLHAFSSKKLDYVKLALCCALAIKTNLKYNHVSVVLDEESKTRLVNFPSKIQSVAFDNLILAKEKFDAKRRKHFDSPWYSFKTKFNNQNRPLSYDYSPYKETIIMDTDYIVMNNDLDSIWENKEDILINNKAVDLQNNSFGSIKEKQLHSHGIPMYWATLVYFKKTNFAHVFFELIKYIREEYTFFQFLYGFDKGMYRNDYSFSIAVHILNGYITKGVKSFPQDTLITSSQKDRIAEIINSKELIFLSQDPKESWKNILVNIKGLNIHVMNKKELLRISDSFIDSCMEKL